ncbi:MAG: AI-2E family transporter [Geminicoccaceae bacterium]
MGLPEPDHQSVESDSDRGPNSEATPTRKAMVGLLAVIAIILTAWALKGSAVVTMPLAFAFFVAVLVHPIERSLAAHLPRRLEWLGVTCAMLAVVGALVLALALVAFALEPVVARAPQYADQLHSHWEALRSWARGHGLPLPQASDLGSTLASNGVHRLLYGLTSAWAVLAFLLLVFFFTLLMLIEASSWRRKTEVALHRWQTAAVLEMMPLVAHKVRWFMLIRTVLGVVSAVLATSWLWLMGVDFAPFWGVLFFLLNYLPNIGSIIAGIPPTVLAFVQLGTGWAFLVAGGLIAMEQIIGNFLDPRLQGRTLNVSSLVVLLSVIFWGWIWGVPGALIAVPLTVTIILVCANTSALRPIAILLSGSADASQLDQPRD